MIKKLVSHLGAYKRAAILTPIISALEAVMDVLLPTIMAFIIDQGIEKGDMNAVIKYGLLTFLVAAIALLLGVLAGKFAAEASTGLAGNLRDAMYENIQHFSFSNIDKYSTAGLVTRMTTDVTNVQNAFQMIERMCVRAPVHLVFALLMASAISGTLSLVFVVAIVFLVAVLASIMIPTFKIFDRVFKNYDNLNASVQENISAIRVVKSFVREHFENEKYTTACESLYKQFVSAESRLSFNNPAMLISVYGCNIALSWFGAHYVLNGAITTGQLNALFGYIMNILMALMMLSMAFVMISMSASSARRIVEVLDETTDLPAPKAPVDTVADGSIAFDHVTFKYKHGSGQPVLNDITFTIRPGETLGIIGGTGSAKSSLVQLIPRLYDAETGTVKVGGVDVRDIDRDHTRGHKVRRRKKLRHIRQIARSCLRVGKHIRRLAHAAQRAAKRRTAPERVTVRAQVRQDQNRVAVAQGRCKLPIIHTSSLTSGVGIVQPLDQGADMRALLDRVVDLKHQFRGVAQVQHGAELTAQPAGGRTQPLFEFLLIVHTEHGEPDLRIAQVARRLDAGDADHALLHTGVFDLREQVCQHALNIIIRSCQFIGSHR